MESITLIGWLGGLLIGWFIVLHFLIVGRAAGCSTGYACVVDTLHKNTNLFGKLDSYKLFFVIGLPLGGLAHALIFNQGVTFSFDMGQYDELTFAASKEVKTLVLFIGGTLLGFGARMAGGCTTGHALVGGALLRWPSLLAAILFFVFATITTWLLFLFA